MEEIFKRKAEVKRAKQLNDQADARRQRNKDARRRREDRINLKLDEFLKKSEVVEAAPVAEAEPAKKESKKEKKQKK